MKTTNDQMEAAYAAYMEASNAYGKALLDHERTARAVRAASDVESVTWKKYLVFIGKKGEHKHTLL